MPDLRLEDTIAAVATPIGEGGISVIRLSGPLAFSIAQKFFRSPKPGQVHDFPPQTLHFGSLATDQGQTVDQVVLGIFRSPHSYTGEDVVEISSHGGLVVTRRILDLLICAGARHADPGEFTRRAFLNGKIDLTQAEAVLDLIKAKSTKSLEIAARQLGGSLSKKFKQLKDRLLSMYAHMEAFLDFPEEDLEIYSDQEFLNQFKQIQEEISDLAKGFRRASILREGICAVLVGKPNVGKSSLFNALLARDRALVSEYPGTTRDILEEALEIQGFYVRLMDTAGLGAQAGHPLDRLGMERTREVLSGADLYLYLVDGSEGLEEADRQAFGLIPQGKPVLVLVNKMDLPLKISFPALEKLTGVKDILRISTKTRQGLDQLEQSLGNFLKEPFSSEGEQITRLRHRHALESALEALRRSEAAFGQKESLEIVILDLKSALDALRELIGEIYSEDLLDVIFAEFCIGK